MWMPHRLACMHIWMYMNMCVCLFMSLCLFVCISWQKKCEVFTIYLHEHGLSMNYRKSVLIYGRNVARKTHLLTSFVFIHLHFLQVFSIFQNHKQIKLYLTLTRFRLRHLLLFPESSLSAAILLFISEICFAYDDEQAKKKKKTYGISVYAYWNSGKNYLFGSIHNEINNVWNKRR